MVAHASLLAEPVRIGCSGWMYQHWRGLFYPAKLAVKRWFAHYGVAREARGCRPVWAHFNNGVHGHAIEDAQPLRATVRQALPASIQTGESRAAVRVAA